MNTSNDGDNRQQEQDEHPCDDCCQLFENKGYITCSQTGQCELHGGPHG